MAKKPGARSWSDVQMVLAAAAMTLTLGLWNVFANRDLASAKENEDQLTAAPTAEITAVDGSPTPLPQVKIMLGGVAPQLQVVQQPSASRGGRNTGGGSVTRTRSS